MAERQTPKSGGTVMTAPIRPTQVINPQRGPTTIAEGLEDAAQGLNRLGRGISNVADMHRDNSTKDAQLALRTATLHRQVTMREKNPNLDEMLPEDAAKVTAETKSDYDSVDVADIRKLYPDADLSDEWIEHNFATAIHAPVAEMAQQNDARIRVQKRFEDASTGFNVERNAFPAATSAETADQLFAAADAQTQAINSQPDTYFSPRFKAQEVEKTNKAFVTSLSASALGVTQENQAVVRSAIDRAHKENRIDPLEREQMLDTVERKLRVDPHGLTSYAATAQTDSAAARLTSGLGTPQQRAIDQKIIFRNESAKATNANGQATPEGIQKAVRKATYPAVLGDLQYKSLYTPSASILPANPLIPNSADLDIFENHDALVSLMPDGQPEVAAANARTILALLTNPKDEALVAAIAAASPSELQSDFIIPLRQASLARVTKVREGRANELGEQNPAIQKMMSDGKHTPKQIASAQFEFQRSIGVPESERQVISSDFMAPLASLLQSGKSQEQADWLRNAVLTYGSDVPRAIASLSSVKDPGTQKSTFEPTALTALVMASKSVNGVPDQSTQLSNINQSSQLVHELGEAMKNGPEIKKNYTKEADEEQRTLAKQALKNQSYLLDRYRLGAANDPVAQKLLFENTPKILEAMIENNIFKKGMRGDKAVQEAVKVFANAAYPVRVGEVGSNKYELMYMGGFDSESKFQQTGVFSGGHNPNAFTSLEQRAELFAAALDSIKHNDPNASPDSGMNLGFRIQRLIPNTASGRLLNLSPAIYGKASPLVNNRLTVPDTTNMSALDVALIPFTDMTNMVTGAKPPLMQPVGSMVVPWTEMYFETKDENGKPKMVPLSDYYDPGTSNWVVKTAGMRAKEYMRGLDPKSPVDVRVKSAVGPETNWRTTSQGLVMTVNANAIGSELAGKVKKANGEILIFNKKGEQITVKPRDLNQAIETYLTPTSLSHY